MSIRVCNARARRLTCELTGVATCAHTCTRTGLVHLCVTCIVLSDGCAEVVSLAPPGDTQGQDERPWGRRRVACGGAAGRPACGRRDRDVPPVGGPRAVLDTRPPEARAPGWSPRGPSSPAHQILLFRLSHSFKIVANMGNLFKQHWGNYRRASSFRADEDGAASPLKRATETVMETGCDIRRPRGTPHGAQASPARQGWPRAMGCNLTGKEAPEVAPEVGAALGRLLWPWGHSGLHCCLRPTAV